MEIKKIIYGNDAICKAIIKGDSGREYVTSIDGDTYDTWCTCPWWILKGKQVTTCKHIIYLIDNLDWSKMKPTKRFENFLSECTTIDTLMGNGFPLGSVTAIFGQPGQGKTLLTAQLALSCIKNLKKDVIILETEGNREQDYLELLLRFSDRFNLTEKEIIKHIHFFTVLGDFDNQAIVILLQMVGYKAELEKSKKGDKYTVTFKEIKPKLKEELLENTGMIVIDSLTKPLKSSIGHKTQNLPARADLVARFFDRIYQIAYKHNIAILINHHASIDNMKWGRDFGKVYGGDEVLYNSKYVMELIDSDMAARAKYGKSARRILLLKHPFNPVTGNLFPVNLKADYGFCDKD